jgi:hypothetical protein
VAACDLERALGNAETKSAIYEGEFLQKLLNQLVDVSREVRTNADRVISNLLDSSDCIVAGTSQRIFVF